MSDNHQDSAVLVIGKITAHYGIKGWFKVRSYTRPEEELGEYNEILVGSKSTDKWINVSLSQLKEQGKSLVAKVASWEAREDVEKYLGCDIAIRRSQLKQLPAGEYYWADMIGLQVVNTSGIAFGVVSSIMETGANDVLVVQTPVVKESVVNQPQEVLIPWIPQVVLNVDVENRLISVDWQEDY